jgi:hypothetical protein
MKLSISHLALPTVLLFATSMAVAAGNPPPPAAEVLVDCSSRALPSQKAIGEMLGQHNFGQVYATRSRLMVEASRACQREGTSQVRLVLAPAASDVQVAHTAAGRREVALARK